jgi:hypothetical protein
LELLSVAIDGMRRDIGSLRINDGYNNGYNDGYQTMGGNEDMWEGIKLCGEAALSDGRARRTLLVAARMPYFFALKVFLL